MGEWDTTKKELPWSSTSAKGSPLLISLLLVQRRWLPCQRVVEVAVEVLLLQVVVVVVIPLPLLLKKRRRKRKYHQTSLAQTMTWVSDSLTECALGVNVVS